MRILIVTQYFWPENFRITDLAINLKSKGHDVTVLTGMPNYPSGKAYEGYNRWWKKRYEVMQGISLIRIPIFLRRESKGWQLALNYLSFVVSGCLLAPWFLRNKKFDVIFCYEPSPVTVALPAIVMKHVKKVPLLFWVQDLWPETLVATGAVQSSTILAMVKKMVKYIYRACDYVLVQSRGFIAPVIAMGAESEKVRYFPNWAELLYQPVDLDMTATERDEVPKQGFVVMFAGNLGVAQSLDTIVSAAERLKYEDIHWVFLGDGREKVWLQNIIIEKALEDKIHILGSRPIETMPAYFSLADVMLVTLRDDPVMATTIPGKVQSYLACGKPVIGALNGEGSKVIHESGAGYCTGADDVDGLANAVLKMSQLSETERDNMGKSARRYYEQNFNRDMLISQLEEWMQDGCSGMDK